jgi:hypothetical protein
LTPPERLRKFRELNKSKPRKRGKRLGNLELQGKVVRMRIEGERQAEIARQLGINVTTVMKYIDQWVIDQTPAPEQVTALRHVMMERLEGLHNKHWHRAVGLDPATNAPTGEGPDAKAGEFLLRIMDRQAKLMGVDLQPNTTTIMISAESIAQFLGWDDAPAPAAGTVIDVQAQELLPASREAE